MLKHIISQLILIAMGCTIALAAEATTAKPQSERLRVGVSAMVTPISTVRYYQEIVDYIAQRMEMDGVMIHRTTYDEMDRMLEAGEVDLAFICSAPYVMNREKFGVELLVAPEVEGKSTYNSTIIVHRDSPFTSFEELKGFTFAFVDPKSNSGRLYPRYLLAKLEATPDNFFSRYFFSYSHNKSIEMVAKKKVDGAAVDSLVLRHMLRSGSPYAEQVKVVHLSPPFGAPPVVVPPGLPIFMKEKVRKIMLTMHEDPRGMELLSLMQIDRFVVVNDADYNEIREMRKFLAESKSTDRQDEEKERSASEVVKFSVVPDDNPRIAYEKYQPLVDYLQKRTGFTFELELKKNHQDILSTFGREENRLAILEPLSYLDARRRFNAVPIAKSVTGDGSPTVESTIVVGPGSQINRLDQLAGKKVAFTALWSAAGNLLPRYMLAWEDIHLEKLGGYRNFDYYDTVVKKVLSGEYDAGAVHRSVADRYAPYGLRTIAVSQPIPTGPLVISPHISYLVVQKVRDALFAMGQDPEGRKVLAGMGEELRGGFIAATDEDYEGIRKMINEVPTTCGIGCHPKVDF